MEKVRGLLPLPPPHPPTDGERSAVTLVPPVERGGDPEECGGDAEERGGDPEERDGDADVVGLARALVRTPSVNPALSSDGIGERRVADLCAAWLESWGFVTRWSEVAPGRSNVVARLDAPAANHGAEEGPVLLLNGHLDTVGVEGMTAGRGWIALALVVFASWLPWRVVVGAYLFGAVTIAQFHVQAQGLGIPSQFLSALPYLATIVVLVLISSNRRMTMRNTPASLGKPFVPER